ncbi:prolyl-tRNA editing enzyme YbaK/EbsC (Cys-tRNA(Pro) deacylase) [Saccharopolyspora erythraea NRRL 2338]|nr:prolyl-tRNA editing enzyme YbaK/EbsC (Cys-tRNA(Pro) deacylase) [Saccharopolyspora erythraea NRRL 2338]
MTLQLRTVEEDQTRSRCQHNNGRLAAPGISAGRAAALRPVTRVTEPLELGCAERTTCANLPRMTNAVDDFSAHLRRLGATGEVVEFETEVPTAAAAAELLGCEVGAIGNSLVFDVGEEPLLIITSGAHRVDTRHVSRTLGLGRIRRATPEFVLAATGQPVGGVGPVGHPEPIRTLVDRHLENYPTVWAGAGTKHRMFPTSFGELLRITGGTAIDVSAG